MISKRNLLTISFLAAECVLYYFILTAGGDTQKWCMYSSIVLCFLYALLHLKTASLLMLGSLACTLGADFCLVVYTPQQQLWGMVFFLGAQTLYAIHLHKASRNKPLLIARLALTVLSEIITVIVLQDKTDPLALVSIAYYANLIMNLIEAFTLFSENKLLPIGFLLFILCDTVIGLQVAAGGYLPISESSLLYRILFMPFPLSWFFYLPSQVLIALSASRSKR